VMTGSLRGDAAEWVMPEGDAEVAPSDAMFLSNKPLECACRARSFSATAIIQQINEHLVGRDAHVSAIFQKGNMNTCLQHARPYCKVVPAA